LGWVGLYYHRHHLIWVCTTQTLSIWKKTWESKLKLLFGPWLKSVFGGFFSLESWIFLLEFPRNVRGRFFHNFVCLAIDKFPKKQAKKWKIEHFHTIISVTGLQKYVFFLKLMLTNRKLFFGNKRKKLCCTALRSQ
jgi:hypothetical protein